MSLPRVMTVLVHLRKSKPDSSHRIFCRNILEKVNNDCVKSFVRSIAMRLKSYPILVLNSIIAQAQAACPCILFFDEMDALASKRDFGGDSEGNTIHSRLLSTLLNALDGVQGGARLDLILIGATNRVDHLDPAVLRPGRMNVIVELDYPHEEDRQVRKVSRNSKSYVHLMCSSRNYWTIISHLNCTCPSSVVKHFFKIHECTSSSSIDAEPSSFSNG